MCMKRSPAAAWAKAHWDMHSNKIIITIIVKPPGAQNWTSAAECHQGGQGKDGQYKQEAAAAGSEGGSSGPTDGSSLGASLPRLRGWLTRWVSLVAVIVVWQKKREERTW